MTFKEIFQECFKKNFDSLDKKEKRIFLRYQQMIDRTGKLNNLFLIAVFYNGQHYESYDLVKIGQQTKLTHQREPDIYQFLNGLTNSFQDSEGFIQELNKAYSLVEKIQLERSVININNKPQNTIQKI